MIQDLATDPRVGDYDVCVIGAGPAGITLAAELAGSGARVVVLESGKLRRTAHADSLKRVESEGIHIKDYSRERVLGGASTTWAGLSSPFDEADFAHRPWLRRSGWPIDRATLLPYYAAAAERYRFPGLERFAPGGFDQLRAKSPLKPEWDDVEEKVFLACAKPQNFGREHRALFQGGGADLLLDATVVELQGAPGSARTDGALLRTSAGAEVALRAQVYVLATGGLENARLLLNSRGQREAGLGNERDQVGRHLMNHPKNYGGLLRLTQPVGDVPYFFGCLVDGYAGYAGLRLREDVQARLGLLNSYVRMEPLFPWSGSEGVESLVWFAKRTQLAMGMMRRRGEKKAVSLRDYSETGDDSDLQNARKSPREVLGLAWNVARDLPRVSRYAWSRVFDRGAPRTQRVRLRNFMEMEPDPENRVTLSAERCPYGRPIPFVRHRCTEVDRRSLVQLHRALAIELPRSGLGLLESELVRDQEPWPIDQDASHHMGTTRMGADPATSVVDSDLRLHEAENVYVAGASTFPTSGCANPTFTLVALSVRLAEHLRRKHFSLDGVTSGERAS
ncbi:MAG: GMC family oxidoreductase [Planctomycetota bacterium]